MKITPEFLSAIAGIILSLAMSYIPKLATWYNAKDSTAKRLIMLVLLAVSSLLIFGLGCIKWIDVPCTEDTVKTLLQMFVIALIANQSTDRISPHVGEKKDS